MMMSLNKVGLVPALVSWLTMMVIWEAPSAGANAVPDDSLIDHNHHHYHNNNKRISSTSSSPFKIVVDGGSTGSRLHIFEFVEEENDDDDESISSKEAPTTTTSETTRRNGTTSTPRTMKGVRCVRRGSSRADVPLSAFGRLASDMGNNGGGIVPPLVPSVVAEHLLPSFQYAAEIVPMEYHNSTGVYYQATAGMRLLDESEQEAVYDALLEGLLQEPSFVFTNMRRKDITTLSGEMEAYYGAVAANFLQGIVDTELRLIDTSSSTSSSTSGKGEMEKKRKGGVASTDVDRHSMPVGALDMGGSSTQIVYMADHERLMKQNENPTCENSYSQQQQQTKKMGGGGFSNSCLPSEAPQLRDDHFFSTSYLSYGVDQFRERLWSTLVQEHVINEERDNPQSCASKFVSNPCANKGYETEWEGFILIGTGNTKECIRQTQRLIPHPVIPIDYTTTTTTKSDNSDDSPSMSVRTGGMVGGVEHPPLRGKFLAMSLYFFSLDSLRVFSQPDEEAHTALNLSWPNPSIEELHNALDGLCSREWHTDMAQQEGVHAYTRPAVLPHRCIETVYMVTLLKDGFGFHPTSRDITFTYLVDGSEVEWTLGMALALNAEERQLGSNNDHEDDEQENEHQYLDMKTIDEQFRIQALTNPMLFGVTLPPTHCC